MFTLPLHLPQSPKRIRLKDEIFSIGSCFSNHIGERLARNKFNTSTNPLGIIYNPYSIFKNLRLLLSDGLDPANYVQNGEVFYHWDTHSELSSTNFEDFQQKIEQQTLKAKKGLLNAKWLIITFGTSKAYRLIDKNIIVANCHKIPQKQFEPISLDKDEIVEDFTQTMDLIRSINPEVEVILTVSPVRHIKDGLIENSLSKATLLKSIDSIIKQDCCTHYFPSYEIMMDILRDYRFYEKDMLHPNELAVNYISEKFFDTFLDDSAKSFISEWKQISKSLEHRPFHPNTKAHKDFLKSLKSKLIKAGSIVDVSSELKHLEKQLSA